MASDFEFLMGSWRVRHRRLRGILCGSDDWYESEGRMSARPILGGLGNTDEVEYQGPDGARLLGMTLRLFDPKTKLWSIWWASSATGQLEPPVVGRFVEGRGEVYGHEIIGGRGVFVRFIWGDITATTCRWQQAFSADGGRTWETNWVAEFGRVG